MLMRPKPLKQSGRLSRSVDFRRLGKWSKSTGMPVMLHAKSARTITTLSCVSLKEDIITISINVFDNFHYNNFILPYSTTNLKIVKSELVYTY